MNVIHVIFFPVKFLPKFKRVAIFFRKGRFPVRHYVAKLFELFNKVLAEAGVKAKGYYYYIANWENMEKTTWKARKMYMDAVRDLNREIPCRLSVFFDLNKFMRTVIGFSKKFIPVPVATAHNFEELPCPTGHNKA